MPKTRCFWSGNRRKPEQSSTADQDNKRKQSLPASDCHSEQRSTADMSSSDGFTAGWHNVPGPSNSGNNSNGTAIFPFMHLPPELRELVYFFAAQPITPLDTGAIPGAPDRVRIPAIAQTSTQVRDEALHVLFKNRPAEVRMHSAYSFNRAVDWAVKCSGHTNSFGMIKFCGRLEQAQNQFFHITLEISDESPHYQVQTRRCASMTADLITTQIKDKLLRFLHGHMDIDPDFKLSGDVVAGMILLIDEASRLHPPPQVA